MTPLDRRSILAAGLGAGLAAGASAAAAAGAGPRPARVAAAADTHGTGLDPRSTADQTAVLQQLIDGAAESGAVLLLPPGHFHCRPLVLRPGSRIVGAGPATVLTALAGGALISGDGAHDATLESLVIDGAHLKSEAREPYGLVRLVNSRLVSLSRIEVRNSAAHAVLVASSTGEIVACRIKLAADAGIHAIDCTGLRISSNDIADCGNNGIQVWQSRAAEDGALIHDNRIARIRADNGGSGQNGNGINVYRAGAVSVSGNRITDCAYSAIRGNAASDIRITSNTCQRLGEVAIYAEFGFEGALIAQNLVDGAATGISVTNFNEGGRLAVVQGNLIRNLFRREHEPEDKRGEGIAVEADATVTGNTIEGAPTAGIVVGWGKYMRDCVVSANLVRSSRSGILLSADPEAGAAFVTGNMISGARDGAIRAHRLGQPFGPDLALSATDTQRIRISGNMAV